MTEIRVSSTATAGRRCGRTLRLLGHIPGVIYALDIITRDDEHILS